MIYGSAGLRSDTIWNVMRAFTELIEFLHLTTNVLLGIRTPFLGSSFALEPPSRLSSAKREPSVMTLRPALEIRLPWPPAPSWSGCIMTPSMIPVVRLNCKPNFSGSRGLIDHRSLSLSTWPETVGVSLIASPIQSLTHGFGSSTSGRSLFGSVYRICQRQQRERH